MQGIGASSLRHAPAEDGKQHLEAATFVLDPAHMNDALRQFSALS